MASNASDFPFGIMDVVELLALRKRRPGANSIYVDCPFCGDGRGKMNVNYVKNAWRCNYCGESGGMLSLYAKMNHVSNSDAYREICDALTTGETSWGYENHSKSAVSSERKTGTDIKEEIPQSPRASDQEIHQTYSLMLEMLSVVPKHMKHLMSEKRSLTEDQIRERNYKSTPPFFLCRSLTERLISQGCKVQGVPGFYLDDNGRWTINFSNKTAGILIPCVGIDGLIKGLQILLDVPLKDKNDPPEKKGAKYIWLSSSSKNMGVTSGSPVHFVGNPFARTIYVTEGLLKADIAHYQMNRSFVAVAGANNLAELDNLCGLLAQNGTELIDHPLREWNTRVKKDKGEACNGAAVVRGTDPIAKGNIGDILAFAKESPDKSKIVQVALALVDGKKILPSTWYGVELTERKGLEE